MNEHAKVGHFDICRAMARGNKDIRMSLLENVTNLSYSKLTKGTTVTIGIDGNLVGAIFNNQFVGGLILCDREQYFAMAKELEQSAETTESTVARLEAENAAMRKELGR